MHKIIIIIMFTLNIIIFSGCGSSGELEHEINRRQIHFRQAHEYFDYISTLPETIKSVGLRSWSEIDKYMAARKEKNRTGNTIYDSEINAVRFTVPSGSGSVRIGDTIRVPFIKTSTGNLLITWDSRWDKDYPYNLFGLENNKSFQLAQHEGGDKRRLEIRSRFSQVNAPYISRIDLRRYNWVAPGRDTAVPGQVNEFIVQGEIWTRFWAYVDFDHLQFSLWVADETTAPVTLFDRLQFTNMDNGLDYFWFEHNSSQTRDGGKELHIWGRNFVVLHNVKNAHEIVALGAEVIP